MNLTFAPLPARAIGDQRLTGIHYRVLAAICLHDRMSGRRGKGQGCWASHKTLTIECGCNYTNLSTAINQLGDWGYVERNPHPLNKRLRVYRVTYTDADTTFAKAANSLPAGKQSAPPPTQIVCPDANNGASIVCPVSQNSSQNQRASTVEYITRSVEDITRSVEIDTSEDAPLCSGGAFEGVTDRNVGAFLAITERRLKTGEVKDAELDGLRDQLEELADALERDDPQCHWAGRVLEIVMDRQGFYDA